MIFLSTHSDASLAREEEGSFLLRQFNFSDIFQNYIARADTYRGEKEEEEEVNFFFFLFIRIVPEADLGSRSQERERGVAQHNSLLAVIKDT